MPDAQVLNARQKRHQRMRSRILDNARALVHENGFEKLSLRAIARRVDYSPAGLYEYFDGKDAIIDALCEATDEQLAEAMQQAQGQSLVDAEVCHTGGGLHYGGLGVS